MNNNNSLSGDENESKSSRKGTPEILVTLEEVTLQPPEMEQPRPLTTVSITLI